MTQLGQSTGCQSDLVSSFRGPRTEGRFSSGFPFKKARHLPAEASQMDIIFFHSNQLMVVVGKHFTFLLIVV